MVFLFATTTSGQIATVGSVSGILGAAITGLIFRGAAEAWRSEKDAAVSRAERLEDKVDEQGLQIADLQTQLDAAKLTNVEHLSAQTAREHRAIVVALEALTREVSRGTIATEFLLKQAFPTAMFPAVDGGGS